MKVEESKYNLLKPTKVSFYFGNFYFFDKIIIGELSDGIHFDLVKVLQVIDKIYNHYGQDFKIVYIANRINSYSTDPQTWTKLQNRGDNFLLAAALVIYNDMGFKVAAIEKQISKTYLKRCNHLDEAFIWALSIIENKN
jgi:hypothetical protein